MRPVLLLLTACAVVAAPARAQVGLGTDIITGVVTAEDGTPIAGVVVEAYALETQLTRRAQTDARGRFTILFPDGGGQYRMTARIIGMAPRQEILARYADEDRLEWNVRLAPGAITLDEITVSAPPTRVVAPDRPTPGSTERALTPDLVARLPLDATDLTLLATLMPGVVAIDATDSSAAGFSVAGLGPDANALTLDGLLFGSATVPQDALRQTRVITSTYDVSRGNFSGGLVAATTRSGTNVVQGSSQYQLRDDDLAPGSEDSPFAQGFTQHVLSGGVGGPLMRDRLFAFGSLQARLRSDPQQTLLSAGPADFTRLGVHPDSVTRFLNALAAQGVPPASVGSGSTRSSDNLSSLVRLDYLVSNSHTLTLRGDWRGTTLDPTRLGPLALPQTGGQLETTGGGAMLTLASRITSRVINELRGYLQGSRSDGAPFSALPQGRVQVASDLPDSARGVSTLVFGGNPGLPSRSHATSLEITNEASWLPGAARHRVKLGGAFLFERSTDHSGDNRAGVFTYPSLAALDAGTPSAFARTLDSPSRRAATMRWSLYAGDVWVATRPLQLTYGVRLEGSRFGNAPDYNPAVDSLFGRRTNRLPSEVHLSPRAGFSLTLGGGRPAPGMAAAPPALIVRGGIGEFRSPVPASLVAQAQRATGLDSTVADIVCIGPSVPAPDWALYGLDPSAVPAQCAGPPAAGLRPLRTVTVLGDGFEAPRAWRVSLGVQRNLTQLFRLSLDASWARGVHQPGVRDLNLVSQPAFTLPGEANRPVFVPPAFIAPASGAVSLAGSRGDTRFGQVLEARSGLASSATLLTVGVGGILGRGILLQTSYTWQRVRSEATGLRGAGIGGGNTAADPNQAEWARGDFERRHGFLSTVTYPLSAALELTALGRLTSGTPFTPAVSSDINGDGARNDRAFVYAPGSGTPEADGMTRLLAGAAPRVRDCLLGQVGRVAARNSCTGPWQTALDFQVNWRPTWFGLNRRLAVSLITVNFLRGLDELLHGAAGAQGWGLAARPDGTLLYVTGFDTTAQRFTYQVNGRFGSTAGSATAVRPPFQLGIQMRLTIGPDRARQALDQLRGRGGGRLGGGFGGSGAGGGAGPLRGPAASPDEVIARLEAAFPNPAAIALALRDSLRLDSAQVARLEPARDSLAARTRARLDSLHRELEREGANPDPARVLTIVRPRFEAARADIFQGLELLRVVLSTEQWVLLPPRLRQVQSRPGPGERRRP